MMVRRRARDLGRLTALDRLRLRISAWYVATCAGILLVLGTGLFFVVAHQIGRELDSTLEESVRALVASDREAGARLLVPGVALYVTDSTGRPLRPDTASAPIARLAERAVRDGAASAALPTSKEHVLRLRALAYRDASGAQRVAVAAADLEDLEDRYLLLITQFVVAAVAALAFVAIGGVLLARKFARPVEVTVERMREFMADAAHELRTPVTVLRTESEVSLARARDDREDAAAFERIASSAARLADVVNDLFTLARAESGELPIERGPLFLDDLLSDAVSAMGSAAMQGGIALRIGEFQEAPVFGSATLLRRVLGILLDNALKYSRPTDTVVASVRASARSVTVEITDTGIGIAADVLPHVFERFYRGCAARESGPGAGLGLAIARRIVEVHGGTLTLSSTPGAGTTARLTLPRRAEEDPLSASRGGPPAESAVM